MIFNRLIIKCENPVKLAQIRVLLVEEDEYQREIFTMKKLLPLAEEKSNSEHLRKYDFTWIRDNYGIIQNVISELILDEPKKISFFYHSPHSIHMEWITVLGQFFKAMLPRPEKEEGVRFSLEIISYDLTNGFSVHNYWDGSEMGNIPSWNYGLIDFAAKHHPGLLNYLKIQDDEYTQAKQEVLNSIERQKNNSMSKSQNHGTC